MTEDRCPTCCVPFSEPPASDDCPVPEQHAEALATLVTCHASRCEREATTRLRVKNDYSFKDRPTSGLDYCDEHAEHVGWKMADGGLRVFLEPLQEVS